MLGWMDDEALAPHADHRPGDVLEPRRARSTGSRARPPATASGSRRSGSTATATPCWSRSTRRGRPATPATAPASTPTCCSPVAEAATRAARASARRRARPRRGAAWPRSPATKPWAGVGPGRDAVPRSAALLGRRRRPVAAGRTPLALVVLACWGVRAGDPRPGPPGGGGARAWSARSACWRSVLGPPVGCREQLRDGSPSRCRRSTSARRGVVLGGPGRRACWRWSRPLLAVRLVPALARDGQPLRRARPPHRRPRSTPGRREQTSTSGRRSTRGTTPLAVDFALDRPAEPRRGAQHV